MLLVMLYCLQNSTIARLEGKQRTGLWRQASDRDVIATSLDILRNLFQINASHT